MYRLLLSLLPILVIVVVVGIFFYPVFVKGFVPLPADHVVGIYYPWLDYKWGGYSAGVPVKNPITADVVSFIYPMQTLAVELMKHGSWPLWNPLILTGAPLFANFQSAPFSPTNLVYWLLPTLDAWTLQVMLQPIFAASFLYLLLRYFGRSKISSTVGGLIYSFSGFMLIWMEWNGHGLVAAIFPLVTLLIFKFLDAGKLIYGFLLSWAITAQIFSGYPQIIIYQFVAIALGIVLFDSKILFKYKKIILLLIFIGLGIGMSMIQILPGYELIKLSQRGTEIVYPEWALLSPISVIRFIAPDYFGNHASYNYWGPADYTQSVGYSGVIAIVLAVLGALKGWKLLGVKLGILWIGMSIVIAFDTPFSRFIYQSGILASQASSSHRIMVLSNLGVAILAAFGLDYIRMGQIKLKELVRALYPVGIVLVSFLTVTTLILIWLKSGDTPVGELAKLQINMIVGFRNLVIPAGLLLSSAFLLFLSRRYVKYSQIIVLIFGVLSILELFRFGWKFTPFAPHELVFPKTPVLEFILNQQKPFRVNANEVVPINLMMPYGIETIEGYDAVYPMKFAKYISALNSGRTDSETMGRYGLIFNPLSNLLSLANVKYVFALKRLDGGKVDPVGTISTAYDNIHYKQVFEAGSVVVLENKNVLPRAVMVYDWEIEKDENSTLKKLIDNYPIKDKVILSEDPLMTQSGIGVSNINLDGYVASKKIEVTSDKQGLLLVTDSLYPGWKALVDGKQEQILSANYNFMAIPIRHPGNHLVELRYMPESFEKGKNLSLLSAIVLFAILIYSYIIKGARKLLK